MPSKRPEEPQNCREAERFRRSSVTSMPSPRQREHDLRMTSKPLTEKSLKSYDCVLIATDHTAYDYPWIVQHAKLVVDTRNATAAVNHGRSKIVKA